MYFLLVKVLTNKLISICEDNNSVPNDPMVKRFVERRCSPIVWIDEIVMVSEPLVDWGRHRRFHRVGLQQALVELFAKHSRQFEHVLVHLAREQRVKDLPARRQREHAR